MKIGIAGPVTLPMLAKYVHSGATLPLGYQFAPMAKWVEALLERGHRVSLFTLAPEASRPATIEGDRLSIHIGRYRAQHRARDFFAAERQDLLNAMREDRCDIIHAHWTYEFAWAALDSGLPTLVTAHDAPLKILRYSLNPYRFMRYLMAKKVVRNTNFLTAVSPYISAHFENRMGFKNKISVVPNAIASDVFSQGQPRSKIEQKECFTVALVLTGFNGLKNGPVALRGFAEMRNMYPKARLLAFGPGYGKGEEAEIWALRNRITQNVEFRGHLEYGRLLETLAKEVDVLLHPSLEESFGMAVAEAMAIGIPVVVGEDSGALPWLVENGRAGVLTDVRHPKRIAAALVRLASDQDLLLQIGKAARNSAMSRFHSDRVFEQYEQVYEQVLQ